MNSIKTRIARLSAAFVLALGMVSVPSAAEAAPSPCPLVEFLGLHGLNEGAPLQLPNKFVWGETIQSVWNNFKQHFPDDRNAVQASAVAYPRTDVSLLEPWTWQNAPFLDAKANEAADELRKQIVEIRLSCASTAIVLAGYSLGAFAVDRTTRNLAQSSSEFERLALQSVVGVFLMGDPGWPRMRTLSPPRAGLATWFNVGYNSEKEYLDNKLSDREFRSICLGLSDGRIDPVCMNVQADLAIWLRDIEVHGLYGEHGVTKNGADFLAELALERSGAR